MPSKIRFHLDENVNPKISAGLRRHGIDVTIAREIGLLGALDPDQLGYAIREGRVLVTHDSDFLALHAAKYEHAGICYCHTESRSIGEMLRKLVLLWSNTVAEDMHGNVVYL